MNVSHTLGVYETSRQYNIPQYSTATIMNNNGKNDQKKNNIVTLKTYRIICHHNMTEDFIAFYYY